MGACKQVVENFPKLARILKNATGWRKKKDKKAKYI